MEVFRIFGVLNGVQSFTLNKVCSEIHDFRSTSNTSLGGLGFERIEGRLIIEDLRYL